MENDVIQRIRQRLRELELSPRAASLKAGLNGDAIRNIFRGRSRNPRYDTLSKIAQVLECDPQWLLTGARRYAAAERRGGLADAPYRPRGGDAGTGAPLPPRPLVPSRLDADFYATIFDAFSNVYREAGVQITTRDLAALALDEYNDLAAERGEASEAEVAAAARRAAARLSRFLRARS